MTEPVQRNTFIEAIKLIVHVVIVCLVLSMVLDGNVEALLAIVLIAILYLAIQLVRFLAGVVGKGMRSLTAFFASIKLPKIPQRIPTKREIAAWFVGEFQEHEAIINQSPLDEDEKESARRQNKSRYRRQLHDEFLADRPIRPEPRPEDN